MPLLIILLQTLTLAIAGPVTSSEYLPLRVADAEGLFTQHGLEVTIRTTRAEPGAAEALVQGQADLVATSLDAMLRFGPRSVNQGARIVFGLTAAPAVALLVPTSQAALVRSVSDLSGTKIGITSPGAPEQAWLGWILSRAGLTLAQPSVMSYGTRGLVGAVEGGDIHAGLVPEPFASRLLADGRASVLVDLRTPAGVGQAVGVTTVNAAVFARADRRPRDATLTAFARAVIEAESRIATASAEELASKLPKRVTTPLEEFTARLETTKQMYLLDGLMTADQLRESIALSRTHQPLPATARIPPPEELMHVEPLRRAITAPAAR